jgi:exodeoxyribonuclease VII small subunit
MAAPSGGKIPDDSPTDPNEEAPDGPSFEQTLHRLEVIVQLLEEGKIGLDEALANYEEGVGLLRKANDLLAGAERRISLLSGVDAQGNPVLRPMEDAASFSLEREAGTSTATPNTVEKISSRRGRRQPESDRP